MVSPSLDISKPWPLALDSSQRARLVPSPNCYAPVRSSLVLGGLVPVYQRARFLAREIKLLIEKLTTTTDESALEKFRCLSAGGAKKT